MDKRLNSDNSKMNVIGDAVFSNGKMEDKLEYKPLECESTKTNQAQSNSSEINTGNVADKTEFLNSEHDPIKSDNKAETQGNAEVYYPQNKNNTRKETQLDLQVNSLTNISPEILYKLPKEPTQCHPKSDSKSKLERKLKITEPDVPDGLQENINEDGATRTLKVPPASAPVTKDEVISQQYDPDNEEVVPLLPPETKVYNRRFYILIMFALLGFTENVAWNAWAPLTKSAEPVFNWSDSDIALLANWGNIANIVSIVFFTWLLDVKGIRWSCVVTAGLLAAGCGFRCITSQLPAATWLINTGQAFIGLAGPVPMAGIPLVSAVWFPVHERTTSTAFALFVGSLGTALSFIIGPLVVPAPSCVIFNSTGYYNWSDCQVNNHTNITNIPEMTQRIMYLMYLEFGCAMLLFLIILLYLPAKPPVPPSITGNQERTAFKQGIRDLFRHRNFWLLGIPYAVSTGVGGGWSSVLGVNLKPLYYVVSQKTAGFIGFYGTLASAANSLVVGRFADIFSRRMKLFLLLLYTGAVLFYAWFAVVCQQIFQLSNTAILVSLYMCMILGSVFITGGTPLFFELVCESCYPIGEGVANGFLTWLSNVTGFIFLLILMAQQYMGTVWMNWFYTGTILICIPILMAFKEKYQRLDIDNSTGGHTKPS